VVARCDPYKEPVPEIPADVIAQTAAVYIHAYETITGQAFSYPPADEAPLDRIRRNLAPYFTAV
jgi:phosphoribosylaminoimidazole-succinocarboxamide synthase